MGLLERLRGSPRRETSHLNPELLQRVADKLLEDLKSGFITEIYEGDPVEESFRREEGYTVVLKLGNKLYQVTNHSNRRYPRLSSLSVHEFRNLDEMRDFFNVQRFSIFYSNGTFGSYGGHRWSNNLSRGYCRLDINQTEARALLTQVERAKVDAKATRWLFNYRTEFAGSRGWNHIVYRWPRLAGQPQEA